MLPALASHEPPCPCGKLLTRSLARHAICTSVMAEDDPHDPNSPSARLKLSRRGFLVGTGLTAATTAALEACTPPETANGSGAQVVGPGRVPLSLRINGAEKQLTVDTRA